jgi:mevalonate kinase
MESRTPSTEVVEKILAFPKEFGSSSGNQELTGAESKAITSSIYLTACIALPFLTHQTTMTSKESSLAPLSVSRGLYIKVTSKGLPVGAGLGSSAALSVATSAALLKLKSLVDEKSTGLTSPLGNVHIPQTATTVTAAAPSVTCNEEETGSIISHQTELVPSDAWLQCINEWAFAAEVVMTGTPSGIDNTVSCFGKAVRYRRGFNGKGPTIDYLPEFNGIKILITDTKVPRETKVLVASVRKLKESSICMGLVLDSIFDSIENVTEAFLSNVEASRNSNSKNTDTITAAGDGGNDTTNNKDAAAAAEVKVIASSMQQLVRINQELLNSIGVGHASLDLVCGLGRKYGFETKLTGAGIYLPN